METGTDLPTSNLVVMNAWYRQKLGITATQESFALDISDARNPWTRHVTVFLEHPDAIVRTNMLVALASIGLAIVAVLLGVLALAK